MQRRFFVKRRQKSNNMRRFYTAAVFAIVIFTAGANYPAEINVAGNYLKNNVVERKLANGITVLMMNRGYSPTVALEISFRAGSVDESYDTSGAAHILEHMLFKGTEEFGTKDYASERKILNRIEAVGETIDRLKLENPGNTRIPQLEAELKSLEEQQAMYSDNSTYDMVYSVNGGVGFNAGTSKDMTSYVVQLPSDKLELWAGVESERLKKPVLREYYKERNNVYEERLTYESNPGRVIYESLYATAFTAHPYRHPVIGWKSNVRYMSVHDVRRFYRDYYIPSRMTITVVGKIDIEKTYSIIDRYFGSMKSRPEPGGIKIIEPQQQGERRAVVRMASRPMLLIAWKKPAVPSIDDFTFDIIASALGSGDSSRLYKSLVIDRKVANNIYAWNGAPGARYDNLFGIFASPADGVTPEQLEQEIYAEIKRFREGITAGEIERVINMSESEFIFMLDDNESIAGQLGYCQTVFGDWRYLVSYIDMIKSINMDMVRAAMDKYMNDDNRTVVVLKDSRGGK